MASMTMPTTELDRHVGDITTALASNCKCVLTTGNLQFTDNTTYAEAVAAAPVGDWYDTAGKAVTWGDNNETAEHGLTVVIDSMEWAYSGSDDAEIVTGYAIVIPSTTRLVAGARLSEGKEMANSLDVLAIMPTITFPAVVGS